MKLYFLLIFYAFLYLIHPNAHSHNPSDEIDPTASPPVQKRIRSSEPPEPIDGPLPLTGFSALPDDIILHIIQFLDPDDQGLQSLHL
ncbi:MAG: F-box protein, partial [Alphaproteobacteria bacterium]